MYTLPTTSSRGPNSGDYQKKTHLMYTITVRTESQVCAAEPTMVMNSVFTLDDKLPLASRIFPLSGSGRDDKESEMIIKTVVFVLCYNAPAMPRYPEDHVFILPHAQEYRRAYSVSIEQVLLCLNKPDLQEGLAEDHYTVEKTFNGHRVYVYYYLTLPLQGERDEVYVIVDFVGYTAENNHVKEKRPKRLLNPAD